MMFLYFGAITVILAVLILIISFVQTFHDYDSYSAESLRLIAGLQLLGGLLLLSSTQMASIIASYALLIVGLSLTGMSWLMAYSLRTAKPGRKRKQKVRA